MSQTIKLRRSATAGKVPNTGSLDLGELAINTTDGKAYLKKDDGTESIQSLVTTDSVTAGSILVSGSMILTGSAEISGSLSVDNSVTASVFEGGSFIGDGSQLTNIASTFDVAAGNKRYEVTTPSTTWSFAHNTDAQYPIIQVYDDNNFVVQPTNIESVDGNNVNVYFDTPFTGTIVVGYGNQPSGSTVFQNFTTPSVSWSFQHDLGTQFVTAQVFDDQFSQLIPDTLVLTSPSTSLATFATSSTGYFVVSVGGDPVSGDILSLSQSLSQRTTDLEIFSSSLDTVLSSSVFEYTGSFTGDGSNLFGVVSSSVSDTAITASFSETSSYVEFSNVDNKPTLVSSSAQISSDISGSFTLVSQSFATDIDSVESDISNIVDGTTTVGSSSFSITSISSSHAVNADIAISSSHALVSDTVNDTNIAYQNQNNSFTGTQTFNNIAVNGTGSFAYLQQITGSIKVIGDEFIQLNTDSPAQRYGGVIVIDSGSFVTASFQWDSEKDIWMQEEVDGTTAGFLTGLSGSKGVETFPSDNTIVKGTDTHQLTDSIITDDGSTVTVGGDIVGNTITANTNFSGNLTGNASTATSSSFSTTAVSSSFSDNSTSSSFSDTSISASHALRSDIADNAELLNNQQPSFYRNADNINAGTLGSGRLSGTYNINVSGNATTATTADNGFPYTGSAEISGSLSVDGLTTLSGSTVIESSGSTVFDIQGSQGQLFSVTDDLTGIIFSINDISGIPVMEADSDGTIVMGPFGLDTLVVTGSNVGIGTDTPTENLHVDGTVSASLFSGDGSSLTFVDSDTLDGLNSSQFLRSDTDDTLNGNLTITGSLTISDTLYQTTTNSNVDSGSIQTIVTIATQSHSAGFFDYVVVSGSNSRAGTLTSVWNGSELTFTETSTTDIGSTDDVVLSSSLSNGNVLLTSTVPSDNWTIKVSTKLI